MNTNPRRVLAGLTAAAALTCLTACGSSADASTAPKNASVADFCRIVEDLDLSDPKGFVDDLADTGTPADITADAREGFEVMIENATADEISDGDQEKVSAFVAYFTSTCAGTP